MIIRKLLKNKNKRRIVLVKYMYRLCGGQLLKLVCRPRKCMIEFKRLLKCLIIVILLIIVMKNVIVSVDSFIPTCCIQQEVLVKLMIFPCSYFLQRLLQLYHVYATTFNNIRFQFSFLWKIFDFVLLFGSRFRCFPMETFRFSMR